MKKGNLLPCHTPLRCGQGPPGPATEFTTHCLGVDCGVSPGGSDLSRVFVRRGGLFFVQRELHWGSTGRVLLCSKLLANGGVQWCVVNALIKFWGYQCSVEDRRDRGSLLVLGRRSQVDRGSRFGAWPTLTKRQGEQPRSLANQGEQYWCLADAQRNKGSFLLLGRRSHADRGSSFGARLTPTSQQGEPLGARPTLIATGGAFWCSADAQVTGGASWCTTNTRINKGSLLVLGQSMIDMGSRLVLGRSSFQ
jgi:hypothetical protein